MTDWLDDLRALSVVEVARAFGLAEGRPCGGRPTFACPACGETTRKGAPQTHDRAEKRGAIEVRHGGAGWWCVQCDATGDAVGLAAWLALGKGSRDLDRDEWNEIRVQCETRGLCQVRGTSGRSQVRATRHKATGGVFHKGAGRVVSPSVEPAPERPSAVELRDLWERCVPVTDDPEVLAWLRGRGLDEEAVETIRAADLARALPLDVPVPAWATCGRPWSRSGHRLIFPVYSAAGAFESVRARRIVEGEPKEAAPWADGGGGSVRRLVMADALGARMLAGDPEAVELVREAGVVVAEGAPDLLTIATSYGDAATSPAVLSVFSGSWSAGFAARIPDGVQAVTIATHDDDQGERYAAEITAALAGRVTVRRAKWKGER